MRDRCSNLVPRALFSNAKMFQLLELNLFQLTPPPPDGELVVCEALFYLKLLKFTCLEIFLILFRL